MSILYVLKYGLLLIYLLLMEKGYIAWFRSREYFFRPEQRVRSSFSFLFLERFEFGSMYVDLVTPKGFVCAVDRNAGWLVELIWGVG